VLGGRPAVHPRQPGQQRADERRRVRPRLHPPETVREQPDELGESLAAGVKV
jgi:hypothetical protein